MGLTDVKPMDPVDPKDLRPLGQRMWYWPGCYDRYGDGSVYVQPGPIPVHTYRHKKTKELIVIPCGQEDQRYVDFFVAEKCELSKV